MNLKKSIVSCLAENKIIENKLRSKLLAHSRKKFLNRKAVNEERWEAELIELKNRLHQAIVFGKDLQMEI